MNARHNSTASVSAFFFGSLIICACFLPRPVQATVTGEVIESLAKMSGHFVDDAGRAAAREGLEAGLKRYGDEAIELAQKGGLALPQAAARHGDEVWRLARLSTEAPRALAARAEPLLELGRKFGDDVVMLEIKAPGTGEILASHLPSAHLAGLARHAAPGELKSLAALSLHETARQAVVAANLCKRGGGRALKWLTPARIASIGFASALVVSAWHAPEALIGLVEALLLGLFGPFVTVLGWVIVLAVIYFVRRPLIKIASRLLRQWKASRSPSVRALIQ